jgi:hypothetical protein
MIDINTEHLERLRMPMAVTSGKKASNLHVIPIINVIPTKLLELTKQEVRTLEGKLIKHFSKQLATRVSCKCTIL